MLRIIEHYFKTPDGLPAQLPLMKSYLSDNGRKICTHVEHPLQRQWFDGKKMEQRNRLNFNSLGIGVLRIVHRDCKIHTADRKGSSPDGRGFLFNNFYKLNRWRSRDAVGYEKITPQKLWIWGYNERSVLYSRGDTIARSNNKSEDIVPAEDDTDSQDAVPVKWPALPASFRRIC